MILANPRERVPDATGQKRYGSSCWLSSIIRRPMRAFCNGHCILHGCGSSLGFGPDTLMPSARAAVKDAARRFAVPPGGRHP